MKRILQFSTLLLLISLACSQTINSSDEKQLSAVELTALASSPDSSSLPTPTLEMPELPPPDPTPTLVQSADLPAGVIPLIVTATQTDEQEYTSEDGSLQIPSVRRKIFLQFWNVGAYGGEHYAVATLVTIHTPLVNGTLCEPSQDGGTPICEQNPELPVLQPDALKLTFSGGPQGVFKSQEGEKETLQGALLREENGDLFVQLAEFLLKVEDTQAFDSWK